MKKKNQGAKKLNNKKLGTRDGTFVCMGQKDLYCLVFSLVLCIQ